MLVFAGAAMAGKVGHVKPFVYDQGKTGGGVATWTAAGLKLEKNRPHQCRSGGWSGVQVRRG
jgi:hypothetical protein